MPESGLSGSVRGVPSNGHPYRDHPMFLLDIRRLLSRGNGPILQPVTVGKRGRFVKWVRSVELGPSVTFPLSPQKPT